MLLSAGSREAGTRNKVTSEEPASPNSSISTDRELSTHVSGQCDLTAKAMGEASR